MRSMTSWNVASIWAATSGARPVSPPRKDSTANDVASSVTTVMPMRPPTPTEASFKAAAVAGSPRGTLAKMTAVRTVVAMTNPRR